MTGDVWIVSYVLLWVAVLVLAFAVVVLLRQIGVLHARLRPVGVHHANEGPRRDAPAPTRRLDFSVADATLVVFTSPTCEICRSLLPSLRRLQRDYHDVRLEEISHGPGTRREFDAWNVRSTPYVVAVDRDGIVRGGGVANSLEQIEVVIEEVLDGEPDLGSPEPDAAHREGTADAG